MPQTIGGDSSRRCDRRHTLFDSAPVLFAMIQIELQRADPFISGFDPRDRGQVRWLDHGAAIADSIMRGRVP